MPILQSKYMKTVDVSATSMATRRWEVVSRSNGGVLGYVRWYGPWRQYCFFPAEETLFNNGCLSAIVKFLDDANTEHREGRPLPAIARAEPTAARPTT